MPKKRKPSKHPVLTKKPKKGHMQKAMTDHMKRLRRKGGTHGKR